MFTSQQDIELGPKLSRRQQEIASAITKESEDTIPKCSIKALRLHVINHEDLQALSVCECNIPGVKGHRTPNDSRLGTLEDGRLCDTCHQTNIDCPGHWGMITLSRWFLAPKFVEQVIHILMSVCNSCGHVLITEKVMRRQGIHELSSLTRLKRLADICVKQQCTNNPVDSMGITRKCIPNPTYSMERMKDSYVVTCEYQDPINKGKTIVMERKIEEIFDIFSRIPQKSLKILGFEGKTHPKDFIIRSIPVIPPCARPYVVREGEMSQDYLTTSYIDIIRYNNLVKQLEGDPDEKVEVEWKKAVRNLYFFISHMIDNSDGKYTRSRDEPIQSVCERISDKTGYIRGAAMGKRVDQSGRSVLGPYNSLRFGEVAYPARMKSFHTTPIKVIPYNLNIIRKMYQLDKILHLNIGSGELKGKRFKIMAHTKDRHCPEIGDEVERIAEDGDETLFNRQPTLHKQSIMGYRAKYIPGYECFGLHSSYTTPHNADFDGDEGNKHKIQTIGARAEVRYIADVGSCIMSAQANKPIMGLVYNAITSGYLLTLDSTMVSENGWNQAIQIVVQFDSSNFEVRRKKHFIPQYSGRAVFSLLLPDNFFYSSGNVKIKNGILISGPLTSKQLGPTAGSIIHCLWKSYGKDRTMQFFTEGQWLLDWFLQYRGFGIGISNVMANEPQKVKEIIQTEFDSAQMKIDAMGPEPDNYTSLEKEIREKEIRSFLDTVSGIGKRIGLEALHKNNPLNVMCSSGAKGKESNIAQIVGCLGQQYVKGERPQNLITKNSRSLPYYEPNTQDVEARGFIKESFFDGIGPGNFMFHMMASRIGLTDTALKTADTGHMHHRINKSLEDFYVYYDGSVRNSMGVIFQYSYSDGFNAGELIPCKSDILGNLISFVDIKGLAEQLNAE